MSGEGLDRGVVRAPGWPIAVAGACSLAAVVTALVGAQMTTAPVPLLVAGYLLGAVITVALSSVFRALRDARRKDPRFRVNLLFDRLVVVVVGLGLVAGLVNAVLLATELAK